MKHGPTSAKGMWWFQWAQVVALVEERVQSRAGIGLHLDHLLGAGNFRALEMT